MHPSTTSTISKKCSISKIFSNNILNTPSTFQIGDGKKEDDVLEITK